MNYVPLMQVPQGFSDDLEELFGFSLLHAMLWF